MGGVSRVVPAHLCSCQCSVEVAQQLSGVHPVWGMSCVAEETLFQFVLPPSTGVTLGSRRTVVAFCMNNCAFDEYCTHFCARGGTGDLRVADALGEYGSGYLMRHCPGVAAAWPLILFFIEISICLVRGCTCSTASRGWQMGAYTSWL